MRIVREEAKGRTHLDGMLMQEAPPAAMKPGAVVEVSIDGIGALRNPVVAG